MKKLFTLLTMLIVAISTSWADDVLLKSVDFTNTTNFPAATYGNADNTTKQTVSGVFIYTYKNKFIKLNNTTPGVDFGGQNLQSDGRQGIAIPVTGVSEKIVVKIYHNQGKTSATYKVGISHATGNDPSVTQTWDLAPTNSGMVKNANDCSLTKTGLKSTDYIVWVGESSSDYKIIKSVEIYTENSSSKTASECAFETAEPAINFPGTATYTQEATTVEGYDGTVNYTLSNNTCGASINETTHEVTVTQEGSVTVTATASETTNYASSSASYTLTVTDTRTNLTGAWSANPTFDKGATPTIPTFEVTGGTKGTDYTVAYTEVSDANNILTVDANDGITAIDTDNPGTATVKATVTVMNTTAYKATTTEYTCTVKVNNVLEAVSDYTWDFTDATEFPDASTIAYTAETYVNNVMIGNGATLRIAEDSKPQRLMLNNKATTSGYYAKIKVAAHSKVTVSAVGGKGRNIYFAENEVGGTQLAKLACTNSSAEDKVLEDSGDGEKVICIYNVDGSDSKYNITLYSITVEPAPREITLSSTDGKTKGFATFCGAKNFTVSGATAYKAAINEDKIVLTTVGNADAVIPANNGIIIAGEKGATATVTFTNDEVTADMDGNSLKGTTARVATSTLKDSATDKVVGFFKTPSAFKSYTGENFPANLAYFLLTAENAVQSFDIVFDSETAINSIDANDNANSAAPIKVIKNGKLYIGNYNVAGQLVK